MKIGDKFGYWEVTGMTTVRKNYSRQKNVKYAVCTCTNCGKKGVLVFVRSLRTGRSTSCGCSKDRYKKTSGEKSKQFTGFREIRGGWWTHLKQSAEVRKLEFSITIEDAWDLYEQQGRRCKLSGLPIVFNAGKGLTTASLDRIDSNVGYVIGNVQWTHKDMNLMKWEFPQNVFVCFCRSVASHQKELSYANSV